MGKKAKKAPPVRKSKVFRPIKRLFKHEYVDESDDSTLDTAVQALDELLAKQQSQRRSPSGNT